VNSGESLFKGLVGRPHRRFCGFRAHWIEGRKARLNAEVERVRTGNELAPRPAHCSLYDASHAAGWNSVSFGCISELTRRLQQLRDEYEPV